MKHKRHDKIAQLQLRAMPVNEATYDSTIDYKVEADADNIVKGYLIVWGVRDTYGTAFVKGCCAKSIRERGPESDSKQKIAHLWQHDICNPTGQFTVLREDDYGLYFEAAMDDIEIGQREYKQVKSGTLNQFSVGFEYMWDRMEYDDQTDTVLLYEIKLYEGSVVTIGSNAETYAMRSPEQQAAHREQLMADTEYFIRSFPRAKQLELRQIISRHISLAQATPGANPLDTVRKPKEDEPNVVAIGGYKLNVNQFKN